MNDSQSQSHFLPRVAAALLLACSLASADTITVTSGDANGGEYGLWLKADGSDFQAYFVGLLDITLTTGAGQFYRDTLCVDLFNDIYIGLPYNTVVMEPDEVPGHNLNWASWLIDNAVLPAQSNFASALPQQDWVTTPAQGAGIQLAIWDIVHDDGDGFFAGRVQASSQTDPTVLYWANLYETISRGESSNLAFVYVNSDPNSGAPAQMLAGPMFHDGGPLPNPEPSAIVLVGTALIALSMTVRRKNRAHSTSKMTTARPK